VFSRRVPDELSPNRIASARMAAPPRFDLTVSNPTECGIPYPDGILTSLADTRGLAYRPHPCGLATARIAVAEEYRRLGVTVDPERIVLTSSTSEAYALLFKLLCNPGEAVLVPTPSYPLFEHLARLEGIETVSYHLDFEARWRVDLRELETAPESVRAVVVVHPNNPTGSYVHAADAAALSALCSRRGWALIVDEVFLEYPLTADLGPAASFARPGSEALTFVLGGLSKSIGLPQAKLSWIAVGGPNALAASALERLEFINDAFLSAGTAVQLALPALLREGAAVRTAIRERCLANLAVLLRAVSGYQSMSVMLPEGGWTATLRFPAVIGEEELVLELLARDGVGVHPGFFFDFPVEGILVISLLPPPALFAEGIRRTLLRISTHLGAT
jgi:alanine-synthesizing transaminase